MSRLATGISVLDRAWGGLRPGETYVVAGRAQSGLPVLLRTAQATVERAQRCVYVASSDPAVLVAQAEALQFDMRAAAQTSRLSLVRPPASTGASDKGLAEQIAGLAHMVAQTPAALVVVEDFTPFLVFQDLDHLSMSVERLIMALHAHPTVLLLGVGVPANDRSAAITERLSRAAAAAIRVESEGEGYRLRLRPGANVALATTTAMWFPAEGTVPGDDDAGGPLEDAPANEDIPANKAQDTPRAHGDGFGDGYAAAGAVGDRVLTNRHPAPPASPPTRPSASAAAPAPTAAAPPAVSEPEKRKDMPSVEDLNASLPEILGRQAYPEASPTPEVDQTPEADPSPDAGAPQESASSTEALPDSSAAPPDPAPERSEATLDEAPAPDMALDMEAMAPSPTDPDSMSHAATTTINLLDLATVTFPINPHLQPSAFEFDGGVLMDSYRPTAGALSIDGRQVQTGTGGTFSTPGSPQLGDGVAMPPGELDFSGAPQFDPEPLRQASSRQAPARTTSPRHDPTRQASAPQAPAPVPQFASLAVHTFDQSPRGVFAKQVQASFERREAIGTPFVALALRMDPSNPFAEAFPLVEDAVREAIDDRDPFYAETEQRRLLALLPGRTQRDVPGVYGAIKAQLQLSGGASDAVFSAIAAVTVPNGEPFANARDLMTFAFDTD